jgi:hypothetical protein
LALDPSLTYPGQIDITDLAGYPKGRAKNSIAIGDGIGTPLEEKWVSDLFGMQQALLAFAGITPTNVPDKVGASQYLDALKFVSDQRTKLALAKAQATNWPERSTYANSSPVNSSVPMAFDPYPSSQGYGGGGGILMCVTADTKSVTSDDGSVFRNEVSFGGVLGVAAYDVKAGQSGGVRAFLASGAGNTNLIRTIDAGTTWSLVATTIPSSSVICHGSGEVWVACGAFGAIQRSTDGGLTWSAAGVTISGWGIGPKRIVWNGSLFVMIAGSALNKLATSPDGLTWTVRTLPVTATWTGLAYSATESLWMVVSAAGHTAVSSNNGLTWAPASSGTPGVTDLACVGSAFVATVLSGLDGGIVYSVNRGVSWSAVAVGDHRVANGWNRVITMDSRFVVAKANGAQLEFALSMRAF